MKTVRELIIELLNYDMGMAVLVDLGRDCTGEITEIENWHEHPIIHFDNWVKAGE